MYAVEQSTLGQSTLYALARTKYKILSETKYTVWSGLKYIL